MAAPEPEGAHGFGGMAEEPGEGAALWVAWTWVARLAPAAAFGGMQALKIEFSGHISGF